MANSIDVRNESQRTVGSITFERPQRLSAYRTAAGFDIRLPLTIRLQLASALDPCPMLSNVSAVIVAMNKAENALTVGHARQEGWVTGAVKEWSGPSELVWTDALPVLLAYERFRDGGPPRFRIAVTAELCHLVPPALAGTRRWRTEPWVVHGEAEVVYPTEAWVQMLKELGVAQPVLIEVPLSASPPTPWDAVWRAVAEAGTAFDRGGETGWKASVSAVRLALDEWRGIEREQPGPGWKPPSREELEKWTTRERIDGIRWLLRHYANLAPHTGAEQWTRDDAVLMLSTLSALLVVREP